MTAAATDAQLASMVSDGAQDVSRNASAATLGCDIAYPSSAAVSVTTARRPRASPAAWRT
jgi:hypothetical protein